MISSEVVVLGPQRLEPTVKRAIEDVEGIDPADRFASVTAGWEEREQEIEELREHLGGQVVSLRLYERSEDVFHRDPALFQALRAREDRLRHLQQLYRIRLSFALDAARELLRRNGGEHDELLESERRSAIEAVRTLDAEHLAHIRVVHEAFEEEWRPGERDSVAHHRAELADVMDGCKALLVAGGHVVVLLDALRLFDVPSLLGDRPLLCWSAGAMALSERVVVFHDSPPQGAGNAEVLEAGLGIFQGVVPLPHAKRRLRLDDPVRVGLFARRFGPDDCVALDEGSRIEWDGSEWTAGPGTRRLLVTGDLEEMTPR